jgi:hypothetical protein
MGPREEESLRIEQRIQQEEPPSPGKQAIITLLFIGFIIGLPSIIDWIGKSTGPRHF